MINRDQIDWLRHNMPQAYIRTLSVDQGNDHASAMLRSAGVYSPEECGYLLVGFSADNDPVYERPDGSKVVFSKEQPMIVVKNRYAKE